MWRLHPSTLSQGACDHRWKTITSLPSEADIMRVRYLTCCRCGLKVKTEEWLAVPWDEVDLVTQVKALLPEWQAVALRDKGITELPLAPLNARLVPYGYVIHARKSRDPKRSVVCTGDDGWEEPFGMFELRPTSSTTSVEMIGSRPKVDQSPAVGKHRGRLN
jgi:hypothetical protein